MASEGSEPDRPKPRLTFHLITACVLLAALGVLYAVLERSRPEKTLAEGSLPLYVPGADHGDEALAAAIRFTPELEVDGPTTLVVELEREAAEGWAGVAVALLHRESGEVRTLDLGSPQAGDRRELRARARVDEVRGGTWIARLEPVWEPGDRDDPAPAPRATLRIRQERRSPVHLLVAALLVVLPALVQIGRRVWYTRRRLHIRGER